MLNYNLVSYIVKNNRLIEKFENLVDKYRIYKNYISYIKEDGSIIFDREKILDSIENKKENLFDAMKYLQIKKYIISKINKKKLFLLSKMVWKNQCIIMMIMNLKKGNIRKGYYKVQLFIPKMV